MSLFNRERFVLLILIFLTTFVILWKLGQGSLLDWDEAIHAQIAKEFVQSGNWLIPHWNYEPYFHKPPLSMWLTATFFNFFGVSEFWARATSAFSGIGLVLVTYLIAKLIYDKFVGYLAILILLTSYVFLLQSRFGTTDVLLTLFTFITIFGYLKLREGNQKWWYLIWIAFAFAFMAKGLGAIIIPSTIIISILFERNSSIIFTSKYLWQGFLLAVLIVLPWHIFMIVQYGMAFVSEYFGYQVLARINSPLEGHEGDLLYYIRVLKNKFSPWFYLVPFALGINLKENLKSSHKSVVFLVLFSLVFGGYGFLVQTKLDWYIFPVYPMLAILIAYMLKKAIQSFPPQPFIVFGLIIGLVFIAFNFDTRKILIFFGLSLFITLIDPLANRKITYQLISIMMCAIFMLSGLGQVKSLYNQPEEAVAKLGRIMTSQNYHYNRPLIVLGIDDPAILYYSNRPVMLAENIKDLAQYIKDGKIYEIVITEKQIKLLSLDQELKIISKTTPLVYGTIQKISRP